MSRILNLTAISALAGLGAAAAAADVVVTSALTDAGTITVSGRMGSVDSDSHDPGPGAGIDGLLDTHAVCQSGPVPAGEIPSLPGTTGIAHADGRGMLRFTPFCGGIVIDALADSRGLNELMEIGGVYQFQASAYCELNFTVDVPTTYTLEVTMALDDQDVTGLFRLDGVAFLFGTGSTGTHTFSGTLNPGSYFMSGGTAVSETIGAPPNAFVETSLISARLTLSPDLPCGGDVNGDGDVNLTDLSIVLAHFGTLSGMELADGDLNCDGAVNLSDLSILLARFGASC